MQTFYLFGCVFYLEESTEESTIRELVNPNVSRVLNFVFRQLLQEYISVTYLSDIKVAFTNGHAESFVVLPIEELDEMLALPNKIWMVT